MKIFETPFRPCPYYVAVVSISWAGFIGLNRFAFEDGGSQTENLWVYIPAGFRLLMVMLLEWNAVVGLIAGRLIEFCLFERGSVQEVLVLAFFAALSPVLALSLMSRSVCVGLNLYGLKARHLWIYAFLAAFFNASLTELYFGLTESFPESVAIGVRTFVGNFLGSILVFFVLSVLVSRLLFRLPLKKNTPDQDL